MSRFFSALSLDLLFPPEWEFLRRVHAFAGEAFCSFFFSKVSWRTLDGRICWGGVFLCTVEDLMRRLCFFQSVARMDGGLGEGMELGNGVRNGGCRVGLCVYI